jgi:hypothetical protein
MPQAVFQVMPELVLQRASRNDAAQHFFAFKP